MTTPMIFRSFGRCEGCYSKCAGLVKPTQGETGVKGGTKWSPYSKIIATSAAADYSLKDVNQKVHRKP